MFPAPLTFKELYHFEGTVSIPFSFGLVQVLKKSE